MDVNLIGYRENSLLPTSLKKAKSTQECQKPHSNTSSEGSSKSIHEWKRDEKRMKTFMYSVRVNSLYRITLDYCTYGSPDQSGVWLNDEKLQNRSKFGWAYCKYIIGSSSWTRLTCLSSSFSLHLQWNETITSFKKVLQCMKYETLWNRWQSSIDRKSVAGTKAIKDHREESVLVMYSHVLNHLLNLYATDYLTADADNITIRFRHATKLEAVTAH